MIDVLVNRLLSENLHDAISKRRQDLKWAANSLKLDDNGFYTVLDLILRYDEKHGQCPPMRKALLEFAQTSDDFDANRCEFLRGTLEELKEIAEVRLKAVRDVNVLIDTVIKDARNQFLLFAAQRVADIVSQGPSPKNATTGKKKLPSGCDDAKSEFYKLMAHDLKSEAAIEAGLLHEHAEAVAVSLDAKLQSEDSSGRMKLGFPHVDNNIVIGKRNLRFIGIMGMSGDGKTTVLNTVVYNLLCGGHNVLYVSLEHDPKEIWEFMAFLHSSHEDYDFELPPLNDWDLAADPESGKQITIQDVENIGGVLTDIRDRRNLPGLLDVQQLRDWESIVAHLETNRAENRYDVLVIDYLARLDVPGDPRFRDQAIKGIIHQAQSLTRSFDDNRGLVLISPMQVNRQGHKQAKAAEEGEMRYDINAIANFSEYQHDMDYIFSVFSDENMKADFQLVMETIKCRKGRKPPMTVLKINPNSGYVCSFASAPARKDDAPPTQGDVPQSPVLQVEEDDLIARGWRP
jgi:KaiC/GvpD/RAD55 family RecA-like ATPase